MSSILTNNSAMVALQTLKGINSNLAKTQGEISTGMKVASAKDNASVWAISKVMESDVKGFQGISESLGIGQSTVAVARNASESITKLLTDIKGKIVAAQGDNADRGKLDTDIKALTAQIKSVVGAAQFNGLNLVDGSQTAFNSNGNAGTDVLSSLDRSSNGVTVSRIGVDSQNLSTTGGTAITTGTLSATTIGPSGGGADAVTVGTFAFLDSSSGAAGSAALKASAAGVDNAVTTGVVEGDALSIQIGDVKGTYVVRAGDTADSLVSGLKSALQQGGISDTDVTLALTSGTLTATNNTNTAMSAAFSVARGSGGLTGLETMSVETSPDARQALSSIEGMIQTSIDAAASFGSVQGRMEIQSDFVGKLTDSLKSGIGTLVDANMEEASARLQALQVQQQLGVQSLSIANQSPQSILSLFR